MTNDYKKKIRMEVTRSFAGGIQPKRGQWYWDQNPSSLKAIERVRERTILKLIDEHEKRHKIGPYAPKRKRKR